MEQAIEEMKKTGRLKLTKTQSVMHYLLPAVFLLLSLAGLYLYQSQESNILLFICLPALALSILYFIRQYRSLRFTVIRATMTEQQFKDMFEALSKEMKWILEFTKEGFIIASTKFRWTNWGTLITMIRGQDTVMINSISELYQRPSNITWGQNRRNIKAFREYMDKHFPTGKNE